MDSSLSQDLPDVRDYDERRWVYQERQEACLLALLRGEVVPDQNAQVRSGMAVTLTNPLSSTDLTGFSRDHKVVRSRHYALLSAALPWPHWSGEDLSALFRWEMSFEHALLLLAHPSSTDELWHHLLWSRSQFRSVTSLSETLPVASSPYRRALAVLSQENSSYDVLQERAQHFVSLPEAALEIYRTLLEESPHLSFPERLELVTALL